MDFVLLVGRILFVALFLASAMGHLTQSKAMGAYAGSKGVPSPVLATQVSGVLILLGGISVLLGLFVLWGVLFVPLSDTDQLIFALCCLAIFIVAVGGIPFAVAMMPSASSSSLRQALKP